jgi:hypothetical protein
LKIDMMKAYDRIEWEYLHGCLCKLGFSPGWIASVMRCVTSARYAVKVNGDLNSCGAFERDQTGRSNQPVFVSFVH